MRERQDQACLHLDSSHVGLLVSTERIRCCILNVIVANRIWPFLQDKKLVFFQSSLHQVYAAQNLLRDPSKHSICSKSQEVLRTHKYSSSPSYRDRFNCTLLSAPFLKCNLQFGVLKDSSSNVNCSVVLRELVGGKEVLWCGCSAGHSAKGSWRLDFSDVLYLLVIISFCLLPDLMFS